MATWQIHDNQFDLSITHSIRAPGEIVYQVLADMEAYPEFISDLVSVKREGDVYRFVARAAILTIPVTVIVLKTPGRSVAFELVEGPVDRLAGAWLVEPGERPGETKVTLTMHAETDERGQWLLRMTGKYVQGKAAKLINAFANRVILLQSGGVAAPAAAQGGAGAGLVGWLKELWRRVAGKEAAAVRQRPAAPTKPAAGLFRDEHSAQTLEALAASMLPADDLDGGAEGLGFVSVAEMRARYESGRAELYRTALAAVDRMAQGMYHKPDFVSLSAEERTGLLDAVRRDQAHGEGEVWGAVSPSSFFDALWEDVVFLYCTHPDTWQRIGFPGPSFDSGGHPDFTQPQEFEGEMHGR
jgi:ribosome-associated toxin RatA of RatAB toxin-antitoxin module